MKNWQLHPARIGECDKIVNFCDTQWRSNLQEGPIWGESVAIAYGQGDRSCANFSFFFNSYIRYLVVLLRFVAMYAFFGEFGQKKSVFWAKSAQKQFYGVWSALLTKFAFTRKNKRRFCCENSKTRLTKICMAIFAFAEKLPTSATLMSTSAGCPKRASFMILNRFKIIWKGSPLPIFIKNFFGTSCLGLHISLNVLPSWADPGSGSPSHLVGKLSFLSHK